MKKHVFAYVETARTYSRTYGGSNYTLTVYDITGGKVERIGEAKACTRGHKGEASEAWSVVLEQRPNIRKLIRARAKASKNAYLLKEIETSYHAWQFKELGVELHSL